MEKVNINLDKEGKGSFTLQEDNERVAYMNFKINDKVLTVEHTKVEEDHEGKGCAIKLFNSMVDYARANDLTVMPKCKFALIQFLKDPEKYSDIWKE